ncbi:choice-of-anchor D domain-containing protein, partial [Streptomyces niveiscabiei]|uniref:choice-of-anchor D domain-containing protein n=1 Tax=Streptomyces niveiscabiei TaxID=164115 RepID=UPI0006EB7103
SRTTGGGGSTPPVVRDARIEPSVREFGMTHVFPAGDAPVLDFTVTNPGDAALDLGPARLSEGGAFSYADGTCGERLEGHASCTVSVEFSPSRLGADSGRLSVEAGGKTLTADLSGTAYTLLTVQLTGGRASSHVTADDAQGRVLCDGYAARTCQIQVTGPLSLTAVLEDPGYRYVMKGWSGACTGSNPCVLSSVPTDDSGAVTAKFAPYLG